MIEYQENEKVPIPRFERMGQEPNMGLVFNKYYPWKLKGEISKTEGWIKKYIIEFNKRRPLNEYDQRYRKMVINRGGILFELECMSDLIIGMGNAHPMENGFTFDHAQGLPFIPGSTIKGIWKAARRFYNSADHDETDENNSKNGKEKEDKTVDNFIFLDAIPISIKMKIDIMTPHYQPYYSSGEPPGDYYSPIPIQFVVVSKESKFLWGMIPRTKANLNEPVTLIQKWLNNFGIGSKTAVGYGRIKMRKVGGRTL